jgi:hypothetical protein
MIGPALSPRQSRMPIIKAGVTASYLPLSSATKFGAG